MKILRYSIFFTTFLLAGLSIFLTYKPASTLIVEPQPGCLAIMDTKQIGSAIKYFFDNGIKLQVLDDPKDLYSQRKELNKQEPGCGKVLTANSYILPLDLYLISASFFGLSLFLQTKQRKSKK